MWEQNVYLIKVYLYCLQSVTHIVAENTFNTTTTTADGLEAQQFVFRVTGSSLT